MTCQTGLARYRPSMTYGPQPGWNPNHPPGYPPGYPAQPPMGQPGPMPMGPQQGQYPMGSANQPPASPATAMVAGALALLTVVLTLARRFTRVGFHFSFHWPYTLDLPGHIVLVAVLGAGGVMLLLRRRPGHVIAIVGAVLDIAVTVFFESGFITIGVWILAIATIVLSALPSTARALTGGRATPPQYLPMGPPGQFGPPAGQPMPGQPMPSQQFPPQSGFPPQQPLMPPHGYPQQQQFPPPPGQ